LKETTDSFAHVIITVLKEEHKNSGLNGSKLSPEVTSKRLRKRYFDNGFFSNN